jgi:hypothetical protein
VWITVVLSENRLQGGDEAPHAINLGVECIGDVTKQYRAVRVVNGDYLNLPLLTGSERTFPDDQYYPGGKTAM